MRTTLPARTWKSVKARRLAPLAAVRVASRADDEVRELTLPELAHATEMTQSELSRLESRADHRISTLRRYVEALGGQIEITALIGKRRVKLTDV
jgi:hypothetical protein